MDLPKRAFIRPIPATEAYGVAVILCLEDDPSSYTLYVDRSYSDFVLGRLRNGAVPGTTSM